MTHTSKDTLVFPSIVLIDDREKAPLSFSNLRADYVHPDWGDGPLLVITEQAHLPSGDYSLHGLTHCVAIERKSLVDLYGTIASHRARFRRELARLAELPMAAVVVEATWEDIYTRPPQGTRLPPDAVLSVVTRWREEFPGVAWRFCDGRRQAELVVLMTLARAANMPAATAETVISR